MSRRYQQTQCLICVTQQSHKKLGSFGSCCCFLWTSVFLVIYLHIIGFKYRLLVFYVNDKPHACDFAVYHHLDLSKLLDPKLINKFPRLAKFIEDIESIETVKSYLNSRPQLIDVGVEPKLVIDGVAHPTGVNKT